MLYRPAKLRPKTTEVPMCVDTIIVDRGPGQKPGPARLILYYHSLSISNAGLMA
jgi:hypothetical protein